MVSAGFGSYGIKILKPYKTGREVIINRVVPTGLEPKPSKKNKNEKSYLTASGTHLAWWILSYGFSA